MKYRISRYQHGGYVGAIDMRCHGVPGCVSAIAVGETKAEALGKAALLAERIANDPVMSALIPPQATAAIATAKTLAAAARRGPATVRRVWRGLRGRGKRKLAQVLHTEAVSALETGALETGSLFGKLRKRVMRKKMRAKQRTREQAREESDEGADNGDEEGGEE